MVRHYKKKRPEPRYTITDIQRAVQDINNGNITYRQAEEIYGVPAAVIFNRIKGRKTNINKTGAGRPPVFSQEVENDVCKCLQARAHMGYPCDKKELTRLITEYVRINNLKTPFANGVPGDDWYQGFMDRHPELSLKKPELLQKNRRDARSPEIVYNFYEKLKNLVEKLNLMNEPGFIYNADETGFNTDPTKIRAIGTKGVSLNRVSGGSGRESITVLACVSADGNVLPPLIIFKGCAVQVRWTSNNAYPGTLYATSNNGWMEEEVFYSWLVSGFIPHIKKIREEKNKLDQGVILLYDGHSSHISVRIIEAALNNNMELVRLPSHLTDLMQPLDKCVFAPVKNLWDRKLIEFGKSQMGKGVGRLSKEKFSKIIGEVWNKAMTSENIKCGFESTGTFPVNESKFPENLFDPIDLKNYQEKISINISNISLDDIHVANTSEEHSHNNMPASQSASSSNVAEIASSVASNIQINEENNVSNFKSIVEIFSSGLRQQEKNTPKIITPRLKRMKYGEVLTTNEVLNRVKEAEEKKRDKNEKQKFKKITKTNKTKNISNSNDLINILNNDKSEDELDVNTTLEENRGKKPKKKRRDKNEKQKCKKITKTNKIKNISNSNDLINILNNDISEDELDIYTTIEENLGEIHYDEPVWKNINAGAFLLVKFLGGTRKKSTFKYVCTVDRVDDIDGEIIVHGLKSYKGRTEFTMTENDTSAINFESVLAILPTPNIREHERKLIYEFPGFIDIYEKN